jgi:hypothetical protein
LDSSLTAFLTFSPRAAPAFFVHRLQMHGPSFSNSMSFWTSFSGRLQKAQVLTTVPTPSPDSLFSARHSGMSLRTQKRRVAARWLRLQASAGGQPIPADVLKFYFDGRTAYAPDTEEGAQLHEAQTSIDLFLPKIMEVLFRKQGDRYYLTASESRGRIFYYFAPRQPIDAFNLGVSIPTGQGPPLLWVHA